MRGELYSRECPSCRKGFGDMESKIIKRVGRDTLILCPGCGIPLAVEGAYDICDIYDGGDQHFWQLNDEEKSIVEKAGVKIIEDE